MMKQYTLALLLAGSALTLNAQETFTVEGRIEGITSGRLYMLAQTGESKIDTIGTALFTAPDFRIEGRIGEPVVATIVVEKYVGGFNFLAEPGVRYNALLKDGPGAYIRGGALQDAWRAYATYSDSLRQVKNLYQERYEKLRGENKFRSASRTNDTLQLYQKRISEETQAFLKQHDDLITAYTYQTHLQSSDAGLDESIRMYESMGPGARGSVCGRIIKERIDRIRKTEQGRPAPDFTLPDLQGRQVTLSKTPGTIKIVDFWASWCGPCRLNNPALKKLYAQYHDKGLEIISISLDDKKERWAKAVADDGLEWINVSSLKGWKCSVAREYNVTGVPAIYILDADNHIIATNLRGEKLAGFLQEKFQ